MGQIVRFTLDDGGTVLVEVNVPIDLEEALIPAERDGQRIVEAAETFESAIDKVRPSAEVIMKKIRDSSDRPDEVEIEFGLKLTAQFGAIVASSSLEANYKVTLKWT